MKKLIFSIVFLASVGALSAQPFSSQSVQRNGQTDQLHFSVKEETNIRYYLVEGSRDNASFEILGRVAAKGNSRLPQSYKSSFYDTSIRYYRIRQVDLTAAGKYSALLQIVPLAQPSRPMMPTEHVAPSAILSSIR
jgi:hypothetical protein